MQGELSKQCSCAQRFDIFDVDPSPYAGLNLETGIDHLQMLGVKYFLATSDTVKQQAATEPRLTKVATTGPWEVYEVADAPLAKGLDHLPVGLDQRPGRHPLVGQAGHRLVHPPRRSGTSTWRRTARPTGRGPPIPTTPESKSIEPGQGHQHAGHPGHDQLRRRRDRQAGPGQDVLLPRLGDRRRRAGRTASPRTSWSSSPPPTTSR